MRTAANLPVGSYPFKRVKIGGGGFVSGIDISADGLRKIHWTDVAGLFVKDSTDKEWRPCFTASSMPAADYDPKPDNGGKADGYGCYAARIAPSNKDIIVAAYNAFVYRTADGGVNWSRMALPAKTMLANTGAQRIWNDKIAIHPTDPNTVIVGTEGDGVHYTTNAGTAGGTWTAIGSVPAGAANGQAAAPHLVAFDPGAPANVYVSRHGTGIYRSTAGVTGAFSLIAGGPTGATHLFVDAGGTVWVCASGGSVGNIWKLARGSSAWVKLGNSKPAHTIAVNPQDLNSVVAANEDGPLMRSLDAGASWVANDAWGGTYPGPIGIYTYATTVPWLGGHVGEGYPSKLIFDPLAQNKLWLSQGLGVSFSAPPSDFVRWNWYDDSAGNDELGFTCVLSIPGNPRPLFGCYDKAIWRPFNLDIYSGRPIFPEAPDGVDHCHQIDYGAGAPSFVAAIINYNRALSGYSVDGGATWKQFAAQHPDGTQYGGALCCPGAGKVIWLPGNNQKGVYTLDYGATWNPLLIGGVQLGGWINGTFINRMPITADKMRPGHVAILLKNEASQDVTKAGVWKSTDSGVTSTKVFSGVIDQSDGADNAQFWHARISYIEGVAGELLYTAGQDFNSKLMYSANDGASWTALRGSEIDKVRKFGFGKPLDGRTYPTVIMFATVKGVAGLYVSYDWFATTPVLMSRFPAGLLSEITAVGGDMNIAGRFYAAVSGLGLVYCDLTDMVQGT